MADADSVRDALRFAHAALGGRCDTPRLDAEVLLAHATGWDTARILARDGDPLPGECLERYRELVRRRAAGEPVAYLTGEREFWSLAFRVSPHTLIPRPDTETLVERALERIPRDADWQVLDLGTGTGNVAVAVALERRRCRITAVDIDHRAVSLASDNARRLGAVNVTVTEGEWFDAVAERRFSLIVSNPPYVASGDARLSAADVGREPPRALVSGVDGLADIRRIVAGAGAHLDDSGWLLLEHGADQGAAVRALFDKAALTQVTTHRDLGGRERVTAGRTARRLPGARGGGI